MPERFTDLWRQPEFLKLWAASAISDVGSRVSALALPLIAALTLGATAWQRGVLSAAGELLGGLSRRLARPSASLRRILRASGRIRRYRPSPSPRCRA